MYSPRLVDRLNDIAHRYRSLIQQAINEVLTQPRYRNTGAGAASVTVDVADGTEEKSPVIQINFADHIKLLDKRSMQWTKWSNIDNLLEWAATKTTGDTAIKKLAFATAYRQKTFDHWKSKPWRKKSLGKVLKELKELVQAEFDRAIEDDLQEAANG